MIYDHQVNMSEVHAPVQANVIIRSQSGQNSNVSLSAIPLRQLVTKTLNLARLLVR